MIPGFAEHAGGFGEDADRAEPGIELDGVFRFNAPVFGAEAVAFLNSAFRIQTVAAHVPFAMATGDARHWIWTADNADDQITFRKAAGGGCFQNFAERFVAEDEIITVRRGPAVVAGHEFKVSAADTQVEGFDQHRTVGERRVRHLTDGGRMRLSGCNC